MAKKAKIESHLPEVESSIERWLRGNVPRMRYALVSKAQLLELEEKIKISTRKRKKHVFVRNLSRSYSRAIRRERKAEAWRSIRGEKLVYRFHLPPEGVSPKSIPREADDVLYALSELQTDILKKTDGCQQKGAPAHNDWITNCQAHSQVYPDISAAIAHLKSL